MLDACLQPFCGLCKGLLAFVRVFDGCRVREAPVDVLPFTGKGRADLACPITDSDNRIEWAANEVAETLRARFEHVILDLPPVAEVAHWNIPDPLLYGVLLVVEAERVGKLVVRGVEIDVTLLMVGGRAAHVPSVRCRNVSGAS